jgi:chemotaxis protein methyltransferase CheR
LIGAEDSDLEKLMQGIYEILGFNADNYEIKHFKRRIHTRMRVTKSPTYMDYLEHLKGSTDEKRRLKSALTINVTAFFRNPEVFKTFHTKVMPRLIERKLKEHRKKLRIWSLGTATGEEPHSIAMIVADSLKNGRERIDVNIIATDIDRAALAIANKGEYEDVSKIPQIYVKRFMEKTLDQKYAFKDSIKSLITFKRHDVFSDPAPKKMDVIFCRNTIIYFNKESKKNLYRLFNNSLVSGGYLVLGMAESFINYHDYGFEPVDRKKHIFKKADSV